MRVWSRQCWLRATGSTSSAGRGLLGLWGPSQASPSAPLRLWACHPSISPLGPSSPAGRGFLQVLY